MESITEFSRKRNNTLGGPSVALIALIQRFGSALNLNVHLHMLILDGAYTL